MLVSVTVEVSPPGVVTVSTPEKVSPAGQSMSEPPPTSMSATPKVAVLVPPPMMDVLVQFRLALIGWAAANGNATNNPNERSARIGADFLICMTLSQKKENSNLN